MTDLSSAFVVVDRVAGLNLNHRISKLNSCNTWAEWYSLTTEFGHSPQSSRVSCDALVERENRPRDDCDPWNVAWCPDGHRRLEIWCDNKVVINWMNGAWEVKGEEHTVPVRGVVDQLVRWYLGGTFWPRTDETDWCRHIFREQNKAADTHANWLMDNGDSGSGAQWEASDLHEQLQKTRHNLMSFDGARREERIGCLDNMVARRNWIL